MSFHSRLWRAQQDHMGEWRVVGADHKVICSRCTKQSAAEMVAAHNLTERNRGYAAWLFHRDRPC